MRRASPSAARTPLPFVSSSLVLALVVLEPLGHFGDRGAVADDLVLDFDALRRSRLRAQRETQDETTDDRNKKAAHRFP
jgi:hypothetical protein